MLRKLWHAVRPAVMWSYERGSWQYDIIVAVILAFIFLTPKDLFRDQPRPPSEAPAEALGEELGDVLNEEPGVTVFWVESSIVENTPQEQVSERLSAVLEQRTGKRFQIVDTRPSLDAEGQVRAYLVYASVAADN